MDAPSAEATLAPFTHAGLHHVRRAYYEAFDGELHVTRETAPA